MRCATSSPAATRRVGAALARTLKAGDIVAFRGELGSGKTTMIQGIVRALGGGQASSPSFVLIATYHGKMPIHHADFYRLKGALDLETIGWDEYVSSGILLVEWADRIPERLPDATVEVSLTIAGRRRRIIEARRVRDPARTNRRGTG